MANPRNSRGVLLLLGLVIGWYVSEKGWHRHVAYLVAIGILLALLAGTANY